MKKIYMSPMMDIIELNNQQMLLAGSLPGGGSTDQNLAPEFDLEFPEQPYPYSEW